MKWFEVEGGSGNDGRDGVVRESEGLCRAVARGKGEVMQKDESEGWKPWEAVAVCSQRVPERASSTIHVHLMVRIGGSSLRREHCYW